MGTKMAGKRIGTDATPTQGHWVQTERKAHEAWASLIRRRPRAAECLHILVAHMGDQNAVVISQKVLAQIMQRSPDTVQRALKDLAAEKWVQVVKIGKGKECAYVINDQVAWGEARSNLRLSMFSARVIADVEDQDPITLDSAPLRKIPALYKGENQLPSGPGLPPPSQPSFDGMEPDLPATVRAEPEQMDVETYIEDRS